MRDQLARAALYEQLVLLRSHAGHPSLRQIADQAIATVPKRKPRHVGHETVRQVFSQDSRYDPSWPIVRAVVHSLGGDEQAFKHLWLAARDELSRPAVVHTCGFPGCTVTRDGAQPRGVRAACQVVDEQGVRFVDFYACSPGHLGGAACAAVRA